MSPVSSMALAATSTSTPQQRQTAMWPSCTPRHATADVRHVPHLLTMQTGARRKVLVLCRRREVVTKRTTGYEDTQAGKPRWRHEQYTVHRPRKQKEGSRKNKPRRARSRTTFGIRKRNSFERGYIYSCESEGEEQVGDESKSQYICTRRSCTSSCKITSFHGSLTLTDFLNVLSHFCPCTCPHSNTERALAQLDHLIPFFLLPPPSFLVVLESINSLTSKSPIIWPGSSTK